MRRRRSETMTLLPLFAPPSLQLPEKPSCVRVSLSGGKDSVASLVLALEHFGPEIVVAHHQVVPEDFEGTVEYSQAVCDFLGVPLFLARSVYNSFLCLSCGHKHLSVYQEEAYCHRCGSHDKQLLGVVDSIHDYIRHRGKWMGGTVRPCTKMFKIETWNTWARGQEEILGKSPLLVLGERHLESKNRRDLPELRYRENFRKSWVLEWRPVLH